MRMLFAVLVWALSLSAVAAFPNFEDSGSSFLSKQFRSKVDQALESIKSIFQNNRRFSPPDDISHSYENKIELVEFISTTAIEAIFGSLKQLGLTDDKFSTARGWVESEDVSIVFTSKREIEYLYNVTYDVDVSPTLEASVTGGSIFSLNAKTKATMTVTKYKYRFRNSVSFHLDRGVGICSRICVNETNVNDSWTTPLSDSHSEYEVYDSKHVIYSPIIWKEKLSISWLLRNVQKIFDIDSSAENYRTPTRNDEVKTALKELENTAQWAARVHKALSIGHTGLSYADRGSLDSISSANLFVPIVPLFEVLPANVTNPSPNVATLSMLAELLSEHQRQLSDQCAVLNQLYSSPTHRPADVRGSDGTPPPPTSQAAVASLVTQHLQQLVRSFQESVTSMEQLLLKQVEQALGRSHLDEADLALYMSHHDRTFLRPPYRPRQISYSVRRSPSHSPEGSIRVEVSYAAGPYSTLSALTLQHGIGSTSPLTMTMPLSASTSVSFVGDYFVHSALTHRFNSNKYHYPSGPQLRVVASARQFSGYLLVLGRLVSPTELQPVHAVIVQNRVELLIPLLLQELPTPGEFQRAVESLSPEQRHFAEAFRSFQLQSTLFSLVVIQIKPQLEAVLNLPPDSLTKEILLTQRLMALFIEHQVPADLMSFDGFASDSVANKVDRVKQHVDRVRLMLEIAANETRLHKQQQEEEQREKKQSERPVGSSIFIGTGSGTQTFHSKLACTSGARLDDDMLVSAAAHTLASAMSPIQPSSSSEFPSSPATSTANPQPEDIRLDGQDRLDDDGNINSAEEVEGTAGSLPALTEYPKLLDGALREQNVRSSLRATILTPATSWEKSSTSSSSSSSSSTLTENDLQREKSAAFDLLDALTRSGGLVCQFAELHVLLGASHSFAESVMDTVGLDGVDPILRLERSQLVLAGALFGISPGQLLPAGSKQLQRLQKLAPELFQIPMVDHGDKGQIN